MMTKQQELLKRIFKASLEKVKTTPITVRGKISMTCKEKGCKGILTGARMMIQEEIRGVLLCTVFVACERCRRLHDLDGNPSFTRDGKRLFQSRRGSAVVCVKDRRRDKVFKKIEAYLC